eukprot:s2084_g7.t1
MLWQRLHLPAGEDKAAMSSASSARIDQRDLSSTARRVGPSAWKCCGSGDGRRTGSATGPLLIAGLEHSPHHLDSELEGQVFLQGGSVQLSPSQQLDNDVLVPAQNLGSDVESFQSGMEINQYTQKTSWSFHWFQN